jgi:hypothetical protein
MCVGSWAHNPLHNHPTPCLHFLHLCITSLPSNGIGEAGARELLTALQFNKTLAQLK